MELASPQVKQIGTNSYAVSHGDDRGIYVEFDTMPEYQEYLSKQEGRPIHKDIEIIRVFMPGRNQPAIRKVITESTPTQPSDPQRFPHQYEAFKNKTKVVLEGTAIEEWTPLTKSEALNMKALNIHTVEMLANVPDTAIESLGLGGRSVRDKARAFIAKSVDNSAFTKLQAENETLKADLQMLKKQVEDLGKSKKETK